MMMESSLYLKLLWFLSMNKTPVLGKFSLLKPALVSQGCCNEGPQTGWLKQPDLLAYSFGGRRSEIQCHQAVLSEGAGRSRACCFCPLRLQAVRAIPGPLGPSLRPLPSIPTQPSPCVLCASSFLRTQPKGPPCCRVTFF